MSLYSKNLTSLDALRLEKQLQNAKADSAIDSILPSNKSDKNSTNTNDNGFDIADAMKAGATIISSKGALNTAIALATPLLSLAKIKVEKKLLSKLIYEVAGSYIKWKTVQLGFSIVSGILNKKSHKR